MGLVSLGIPIATLGIPLGSAQNWEIQPTSCPSLDGAEFPGQDCTPDDICGDSSGTAQCFDTSTITAPAANTTTTSNVDDEGFDGGYLVNCYATADAAAPFCDNSGSFWCDRNSTHYSTWNRQTICVGTDSGGDFGINVAGECRTDGGGYFACDGSIEDADGCEIDAGASCGSGTGTIQLDECFDANNGNCTRSSDFLDCDNDDSDNNEITCNGGNGCEINPDTSTNNSNSVYLSCTSFECSGNNTLNGWLDCDSGAADPLGGIGLDANGCEIQNNSACSVGGLDGTIGMCSGGAGNCVVDPQDIATTGEEVVWSGSEAMLWLRQLGGGYGINMTFVNNKSFLVNETGAFWDFQNLLDGGGGGSDGTGGWTNNSVETNTTLNVNIGGNLTLADKITFRLGEMIDNIVDGFLRFTGNVNVTENLIVTGNVTTQSIQDPNSDAKINFDNGKIVVVMAR